ncbi:C-type lectin domain family 4 member M-like isoform X2 [Rhineura floridana]|uniref:C-type lectin domain family 4 member M-like isoform X2 n=1 Tax=Rhineura floridana TaxID=261503 RepID=UPI002AC8245F|nr:C-type lectin domain family 4 member M-like isoform X2 [Rhineura floridana]
MYFAEMKKREVLQMGIEMIRSFIIGLDSYYEDKDEVITENLKSGWMLYNRNLYFVTRERSSWWDSKKGCEKEGSDLVSIETLEEQDYLTDHAKSINTVFWIGMFKDKGTTWAWLGGSAVGSTYWSSDEPGSKEKHHCAAIISGTRRFSWKTYTCATKLASCCKKEPDDRWL